MDDCLGFLVLPVEAVGTMKERDVRGVIKTSKMRLVWDDSLI